MISLYFSKEELDMLNIMIDSLHAQVDLSKEEREIVSKISEKVRREKEKRST